MLYQASGQQRSGCGGGGGRTHTSALLRVHARNVARTAQPAQAGYDYLRLPDRFHAAGGAILSQNRRMQRQFLVYESASEKAFPACTEERRLLVPGRRSMLGRKLLNWFNSQGLQVEILGEFDDAALMKAFGATHDAIFVAPSLYSLDFYADESVIEIGRVENVMEEYHAIFAERMIQHPAVQRICNADYSALFKLQ